MNENTKKFDLPYNADIDLLEKILGDLKNTGSDGLKLETLWVDTGSAKNINRSYTLNLARYLGLVTADNTKVWLTNLGMKLRYGTKEDRNKILVQEMPEKYLSIFKWILDAGELRSSEIKTKYIDAWDTPSSNIVLDRAIATFLSYCQWLTLLTHAGRGNQSKAIISNFGRRALDSVMPSNLEEANKKEGDSGNKKDVEEKKFTLSTEAIYPIKIITNDRVFDWDIKAETDLIVIDSVIASIKEGWKLKQQSENFSNHIKGEKDSLTST